MPTETFAPGEDWTVPPGVFRLTVELEGEAGEEIEGETNDVVGDSGDGGRVVGELPVEPGDVLYIRETQGGDGKQRGGNAIDIRRGGTALADRVAVAAGAGAGGVAFDAFAGSGGDGGANTGEDGETTDSGGDGGTQTAGGAGGTDDVDGEDGTLGGGGDGGDGVGNGGGGGGGYYGGGGGAGVDNPQGGDPAYGGGGGSNYDDGLDSVTANERGTSTRSFDDGSLVTVDYEQQVGAKNASVTDSTTTTNTLDWDAPPLLPEVDSINQYRVYRATDPGTERADYTEVGTTTTPGFEDTGLDNGIEYHYRIGADLFLPEAEGTITITDFRGV